MLGPRFSRAVCAGKGRRRVAAGVSPMSADRGLEDGRRRAHTSSANVVVVGGGVIGCSVAYHLAEAGVTDVVLLEQGKVSSGTTWHSAGLVGLPSKESALERRYIRYAIELYSKILPHDTGLSTGYRDCGSLVLAETADREHSLRRNFDSLKYAGDSPEWLTPEQIAERYPMINVTNLKGGLLTTQDGMVNPTSLTKAYVTAFISKGGTVLEDSEVISIGVSHNKVRKVITRQNEIACNAFVNAAGLWAPKIGMLSHPPARVPLQACQHTYLITEPFNVPKSLPVTRDLDARMYFREWNGGLLVGTFERDPRLCFIDGPPSDFQFSLFPPDVDHCIPMVERLLQRLNNAGDAKIREIVNGPESFTPDSRPLLGRVPKFWNYYIAAGLNSHGVMFSAGVGHDLARWIIQQDTPVGCNLWQFDVTRFIPEQSNRTYLRNRVIESLPSCYEIPYPMTEPRTGRRLLATPLYPRLEEQGAIFGESGGMERALFFAQHHQDYETLWDLCRRTFKKPGWFELVRNEYFATKQNVTIMELSSYCKFMIKGRSAAQFLSRMSYMDCDVAPGTTVHTGFLNPLGGLETDGKIFRISNNVFYMIGPTVQRARLRQILKEGLGNNRRDPKTCEVEDVSSQYVILNVVGPNAEAVLRRLTHEPLDSSNFRIMTGRVMEVGEASDVLVCRSTNCDEPGFMLHVPSEQAVGLYDSIMDSGRDFQISNAGFHVMRTLRVEKLYTLWGREFHRLDTPITLGRDAKLNLDDGGREWVGKTALKEQKELGILERCCSFQLEHHDMHNDVWCWGGEPVTAADLSGGGELVGHVMAATCSYSLDKLVGVVRIRNPNTEQRDRSSLLKYIRESKFTVHIGAQQFPLKLSFYPIKLPLVTAAGGGQLFGKVSDIRI